MVIVNTICVSKLIINAYGINNIIELTNKTYGVNNAIVKEVNK